MAAPRVILQGLRQSRLQRVAMNIKDELKKIRIGFDKQGLVPAPEQGTIVAMAAVKSLGVDPVDMPQTSGKIRVWGPNREVIVLCEAADYVKLRFFLSGLSFIFSHGSIFYCT